MSKGELKIILVEDSNEDAELTIRSLKKAGLGNEIVRLHDGEEALNYFFGEDKHNQLPKLILLDLKMPKVDGLEVLKHLRNNKQTKHLPIVMLTSSKEQQDIVNSYKLGVNSYIVKPVDFKSFTQAIQDIGKYWLILNEHP
jgi:two-component system response regulator